MKAPLPFHAPRNKLHLAIYLLNRISKFDCHSGVSPELLREKLFVQASGHSDKRNEILDRVAQDLSLTAQQVEERLFDDLPDERRFIELPTLSIQEYCLRANLCLAQSLIAKATRVKLFIEGNSRSVIQHAKKRGLISVIRTPNLGAHAEITISGPYVLFRKTTIYGRHLAELVPLLTWCPHFHLHASCLFKKRLFEVRLQSGDPIFPSEPPKLYDSKLEEKFAENFRKAAPEWDLIREPEPLRSQDTLIFPDFAIQKRGVPSTRWFLEIMGFWTPEYVVSKLERLKKANLPPFILCLREDYNCSNQELPKTAEIVRFKTRIDPKNILSIIERDVTTGEMNWHR